jgi:hypothetical protein
MTPAESDAPVKKPNIIQATLLFDLPTPPPKVPIEEVKEEEPQPIEPEQLPVTEPPADNPIAPISEPVVIPPPQVLPAKREEVLQEKPEQIKEIKASILNSEIRAPATSMARRHLSSFQQQQQNKMAQQASRYYQQNKNSPIINEEVKNPFMTEDEKIRDSLKVRADCSSTGKQTAAVLLSFLGAQVDCSKPPPISSFIQDRINKNAHLPGQQTQEDQKRPQSVVIKE